MSRKIRTVPFGIAGTAMVCLFLAARISLGANGGDNVGGEKKIDPRELLQTVAQARQEVASGEMELDVGRLRIKAVFDGEHRRFELFDREYSYVLMGPDAAAVTDAKMRELGLDQEAAVKAGLLSGFDSHRVMAYDGTALLNYWETDGRSFQTEISDPAKGSGSYVFDPRILGLTPVLFPTLTIETCMAYRDAKAVNLVGRESVEGIAAWHVHVLDKWNMNHDFWIETSHPSHVVKAQYNRSAVFSKFDGTLPTDPIPIEVVGSDGSHFLRRNTRFNVPVDPASWTLAGLKMQIGTAVGDVRILRRIGYWDGSGLSQEPVSKTGRSALEEQRPPNPDKLLALAEKDPKSSFALDAATWIILNTPDGPDVGKAADIIRRDFVENTNLVPLCDGLVALRHGCATELLRSVIKGNPEANVRAHACFALATILKSQANESGNSQAADESAQMFERVIADYGQATDPRGAKLADQAKSELFELHRLGLGCVAPEIEGVGLDGRKMKLSDYRGKVVVLSFWSTWCGACMQMVPDERKLVERMVGKPFALIGVNGDGDLAKVKRVMETEHITWASFRDGNSGPIAKAWNVWSWPTVYVLDREGVIRYRDLRGKALAESVEALVQVQSGPQGSGHEDSPSTTR